MKTYPQKPPMTDDERAAFLQKAPIARLGSINPDGTVHLAALWFTYDKTSGSLMFGSQDMTHKVRNIKRNPKVTVLIDTEGPPLKGVLMYGQAELDYRDVMTKRVAIFREIHAQRRRHQVCGDDGEQLYAGHHSGAAHARVFV